MTRSVVDQLVQQGRFNSEQIIELTPESFVKLQHRVLRAQAQRRADLSAVFMGGPAVLACTIALCMAMARAHMVGTKPHVDPKVDITAPEGGW